MTAIAEPTAQRAEAHTEDRTSRAMVFTDIAHYATRDLLPLPKSIEVSAASQLATITLPDGDRYGVDRWAAELGLPTPKQANAYRDTHGQPWATYLTTGTHPLWHGWHVSVCCSIALHARTGV